MNKDIEQAKMLPSDLIETCAAKVWMNDGIMRLSFFPGTEITLEAAGEITAAFEHLSDGIKFPYLVDTRNVKSATRAVRIYASRPELSKVRSASAILIASPMSKALGNIYLKLNPPPLSFKDVLFRERSS